MTTPSEPTGIKPTEYDVEVWVGFPKTILRGLTNNGQDWMARNMKGSERGRLNITHEATKEVIMLMRSKGLSVIVCGPRGKYYD